MKISEAIIALQQQLKQHGDVDCCIELEVAEGETRRQHAPVKAIIVQPERPVVSWGALSGRDVAVFR